tara:strand:+ start:417 stop:617 length:201 start_codon:yes stop_codon:yes gene_type:complete
MDTQKNIESLERDNSILKLVGNNTNNLHLVKKILDKLTTRIEKLEDRVSYLDLLTVATDKLKEKND